jgi:hypothetical protein
MKVLTPIFTSRLQYAIEIFTDPSGAICDGRKEDSQIETIFKADKETILVVF